MFSSLFGSAMGCLRRLKFWQRRQRRLAEAAGVYLGRLWTKAVPPNGGGIRDTEGNSLVRAFLGINFVARGLEFEMARPHSAQSVACNPPVLQEIVEAADEFQELNPLSD
jgi:hypothetical protein